MAKDPAFLFYPGDWMGGTMVMTRHQKGCYMDLLIAQFNNGPLSLESIKTILGQDQAAWTVLSSKFKKDSRGNYFNERLATEIEKRKKFSESRREILNKKFKVPGLLIQPLPEQLPAPVFPIREFSDGRFHSELKSRFCEICPFGLVENISLFIGHSDKRILTFSCS